MSQDYAVIKTGGKQYRVREGDQIDVEKINADPTKLDKTKRLARANAEVVRLQGNIIKLEKQLSAYVSRQRLSFARLLEERDQNGNLDRDTAELVATLIGKPKGKKTKRRKRRSRTKRR